MNKKLDVIYYAARGNVGDIASQAYKRGIFIGQEPFLKQRRIEDMFFINNLKHSQIDVRFQIYKKINIFFKFFNIYIIIFSRGNIELGQETFES